MISVLMVDPFVYEASLDGSGVGAGTVITVDLSHEVYVALTSRQFTQEWLIIQAIQYLLERGDDLGDRIDLGVFLEDASFVTEIDRRLNRR